MPCQSVTANYSFKYAASSVDVFGANATNRIISMNSTIGLGSESSNLNFTIVGEPGGNQYLSAEQSVGQPVNFTCNGFSFGGLLKSVKTTEDQNGYTAQVTVTCAKEILAKYDVMLNKTGCSFASNTRTPGPGLTVINGGFYNAKNIHHSLEGKSTNQIACAGANGGDGRYGNVLPSGRSCGTYGAANEWGKVARGSTTYAKAMEGMGGLVGIGTWGGTGVYVNLGIIRAIANEIPYASTSAYKMTLLELVSAICDEAGYDFHCNMNGNIVTFSLIYKKIESIFGTVKNIIDKAKSDSKCISSSYGAESKNEKTQRIVFGANVNYVKELYAPSTADVGAVIGFWKDGEPIYSNYPDFFLNYDTSSLAEALAVAGIYGFPTSYRISERELIACGTLDTWKLFGIENPASLSSKCLELCGMDPDSAATFIRKYGAIHYVGHAAVEAVKALGEKTYNANVYEEICYAFFRNVYETYYGKYFMVTLKGNLNRTCFFDPTGYIQNTGRYLGEGGAGVMQDVAVQAGWPDGENQVLGLQNLQVFIENSGKLTCFVGIPLDHTLSRGIYDASFDLASFNGDFYIDKNTNVCYAKCDVDGRMYNLGGSLGILVKMPSMITQKVNLPDTANNNGIRAMSLCYGVNVDGSGDGWGDGTLNTSYANIFKENLAAGGFTKIALPMRNNQINYGPWVGGNFGVGGGVDLVVKDDLNPWQYGGFSSMNTAGNRLAKDGLPFRTRYESGHVTIAESPAESLGSVQAGPLLASIVVKFDKGGSTTTYNYETYKPKFGNFADNFNEYFKKNVSDRRDNWNVLKDTYLETVRNMANAMRSVGGIRDRLSHIDVQGGAGASSASVGMILMASYPQPYQGQDDYCKIEAGTIKGYNSDIFQDKQNYMRYAAVDMGMLFAPFSLDPTSMMGYMESGKQDYYKMGPVPRMPPYEVNSQVHGNKHITNFILNPYTTRSLFDSYFNNMGQTYGIQTDYLTFGSDINKMCDLDNDKQDYTNIRGVALRGPLMLHGWGYDTEGKPVPNENPSAPSRKFASNFLSSPQTWPVGPVDLRWDERRGVWVSPPTERLVIAQLLEDLRIGGTARAVIIINALYNNTFSDDGEQFNTKDTYFEPCKIDEQADTRYPQILVRELLARPANKGSRMICYHIGDGSYIPLMIADTYKRDTVSICCDQPSQSRSSPCYENSNSPCKDAGLVAAIDFGPMMAEGLNPDGSKVLYNLVKAFVPPTVATQQNGQIHVLGYTKTNNIGFPCMTGIPIVNCSGTYPGGSSGGIPGY